MQLPRARTTDIITQPTGNELLVYNLSANKAFNLNETAAIVFNHCDGTHTINELKNKHKYTDDLIFLALDELKRNGLIDAEVENRFTGLSRREAVKRVGLGSMAALPIITSLIAPTATNAQSRNCIGSGQTRTIPINCDPSDGNCFVNTCASACCSGRIAGVSNNFNGTEQCSCQ
jgi:hypothetical protein